MQEMHVWSLGGEDLLEKEMATHSSILAWKMSWTEKPGRLQSIRLQRVRHYWAHMSLKLLFQLHKHLLNTLWKYLASNFNGHAWANLHSCSQSQAFIHLFIYPSVVACIFWFPCKSVCWKPTTQHDGIRKWSFWELIGRVLMNGISALEKGPRELAWPFCQVGIQGKVYKL